jgi:hypothetical protein
MFTDLIDYRGANISDGFMIKNRPILKFYLSAT